jgi:hypothetical protein
MRLLSRDRKAAESECQADTALRRKVKLDEIGHDASRPPAASQNVILNLPKANKLPLLEAGPKKYLRLHLYTACDVDQFFSYRKERSRSGRLPSAIAIRPACALSGLALVNTAKRGFEGHADSKPTGADHDQSR